MSAIRQAMPCAGNNGAAHDYFLVAPPAGVAAARAIGLQPAGVSEEFPAPLPGSGLLVCLPPTPARELPLGWTGVWAHAEAPPQGPWIPLPSAAADDQQALGLALLAAEHWRRERLVSLEQARDPAATLKAVNEIGIALSSERNQARLLELILRHARHLVAADAGSLYLLEKDGAHLRFAVAQNDSVNAPWKEIVLPLTRHSIAGAVALEGKVIIIDDAYALPDAGPLRHNDSFDQRFGYRTRSIVGIPLATREGEMLGVLQLINRKPQAGVPLADPASAAEVLPFSAADVELLRSLASQAAVSLENSNLYEDIQQLFEGFVHAAVTAIERRDPTTSGHSRRVAEGTLALARRVERQTRGPWAGTRFSDEKLRELKYAAVLHDFGKVGVREDVLTKARKLYDGQLVNLQQRFLLARACRHTEHLEAWLQAALQDPDSVRKRLPQLYADLDQDLADLDALLRTVLAANQPTVIDEGDFAALEAIRQRQFVAPDGRLYNLLTAEEVYALSLRRGSLTAEERTQIESHVTYTYEFLCAIPWTRDLARVPELAYGHHEKLDGSGYPRGLTGADIPLGVRLITIADIFDALTARDRPYKKAMPLERALAILEAEAHSGKLDADLVRLWIESKAWEDITTP